MATKWRVDIIERELAGGPLICEWQPENDRTVPCDSNDPRRCPSCHLLPVVAAFIREREKGLREEIMAEARKAFMTWHGSACECWLCSDMRTMRAEIPTLEAQIADAQQEVDAAMAVLMPSMPEGGLVDACRQVKQAAISGRDNCATLEAENAALKTEVELLREEIDELKAALVELRGKRT